MKPKLELLREEKLYKLLPGRKKKSALEASGVTLVNGDAYIIFDSLNLVGKVDPKLKSSRSNRLIPAISPGTGFEDITFDPKAKRFYLIIESEEDTDGKEVSGRQIELETESIRNTTPFPADTSAIR